MLSMSDLRTRAGQALRTLTHHRAAGPVLGALAILRRSVRHSSGSWNPVGVYYV
jgi:hypothetical protein